MNTKLNKRILVIDDDENIRESFKDILLPQKAKDPELSSASARLFDDTPVALPVESTGFDFTVDAACNGKEGLECVEKSIEDNQPYAVIFVDMRMPGWDGLQTVQYIRKIEKRAEIIFVTAYSDHSIAEIVREAGSNVGYHCKPFEIDEIRQLATKSIYDWNKTRNLEALISSISSLKTDDWNTDVLLHNILHQLAEMLGTESAMLLQHEGDTFRKVLAIGELSSDTIAEPMISTLPATIDSQEPMHDDYAYFKLDKYGVVVLFEKPHDQLQREHLYLVRLFLEHAGQTLVNAELNQSLVRQESLSAIGQAVSMINHDMRNIVGVIIGCSDLLEMDNDEAQTKELLGIIQSSAKDGLLMIEDMLDFVRGTPPKLTENDSSEFMEKVNKRVEFLQKRFPEVKFKLEQPQDFTFQCDTTKIIRVVDNLLSNAGDAINGSSNGAGQVVVSLNKGEEKTFLTVQDNGPGIPDKIRDDLFTPFQTHGKQHGTGLGLAIVKQFIDSHNGTVGFESEPGKTVFKIAI